MGLINLLEQLTEFRKPVYSLDHYLIIGLLQRMLKDTNQQSDEEIQWVKFQAKECLSWWCLGLGTVAYGKHSGSLTWKLSQTYSFGVL